MGGARGVCTKIGQDNLILIYLFIVILILY